MLPSKPDKELLTARELAGKLSISLSTFWKMVARGDLPTPIRFTSRLVRWRIIDIRDHLAKLYPSSGERRGVSGVGPTCTPH